MRLTKIHFTNYRCFDDLVTDFDPHCTVLVAANGRGKTSVLEGISCLLSAFIGRFKGHAVSMPKDTDYREQWRHSGSPTGAFVSYRMGAYMSLEGSFETVRDYTKEGFAPPRFQCDLIRAKDKTDATASKQKPSRHGLRSIWQFADLFADQEGCGRELEFPILAYYGTHRAVLSLKSSGRRSMRSRLTRDMAYAHALDGNLSYQSMAEWLQLEEDIQKDEIIASSDFSHKSLAFQTIKLAVEKMLPGFQNLRSQRTPFHLLVDIVEGDSFRSVIVDEQLSDGYQIVLALVLDIVSRMLKANSSLPNQTPESILGASGIVLVDEIDLHLHPSWQQRILPDLMKTFPNLQFIVTTHSPQVVSSVPASSIRVLNETGEVLLQDKSEGVEASQVLDRVFGMKSYPADNPLRQKLNWYLKEVNEERWDDPAVRKAGEELRPYFEGVSTDYDLALLHIENEEWERAHAQN